MGGAGALSHDMPHSFAMFSCSCWCVCSWMEPGADPWHVNLQEDLDAAVHICGRHDASWRGQVCGRRPEPHDAGPAVADGAVAA